MENVQVPVVEIEPLTPEEWGDFLEALGEARERGDISEADQVQMIRREEYLWFGM